ncbi:MAG: SDR family oxidoreductase [Gammaproteobacteria bacterium]|nr:SDR family oxidoreductase [Gammaproteobacteria bacterium]MCF6229832.1 SDR family oxidoreductase [Gammaproteobacteria bacterium]
MNVLITGANRGIGLAFANYYLAQGAEVWACYRGDHSSLTALKTDKLHLLKWDVTEPSPQQGSLPQALDILINNAGIYGPKKQAGQSLENITSQVMMDLFQVNCIGALQVTRTLQSALMAAKGTVANISSKMGSSDDNGSGSGYAYRASKAALIITSKSLAIDLLDKGIRVITLHPGWVKTDMTNHNGEITVQISVEGMGKVIQHIDQYPIGAFVAYDGEQVPY